MSEALQPGMEAPQSSFLEALSEALQLGLEAPPNPFPKALSEAPQLGLKADPRVLYLQLLKLCKFNIKVLGYQAQIIVRSRGMHNVQYRSHFGSRYKSGPCFTAGLLHLSQSGMWINGQKCSCSNCWVGGPCLCCSLRRHTCQGMNPA